MCLGRKFVVHGGRFQHGSATIAVGFENTSFGEYQPRHFLGRLLSFSWTTKITLGNVSPKAPICNTLFPHMALVLIALGSNLGNRIAHLQAARDLLKNLGAPGTFEQSPVYQTTPVLCPDECWKSPTRACCIGDSCSNHSAKSRLNSDFPAIMLP